MMPFQRIKLILTFGLLVISIFLLSAIPAVVNGSAGAQDMGPTVTGTPIGPYIIVNGAPGEQINVRGCANATTCPKVGVLLAAQKVPAKGRTEGGVWIQIEYPGVAGGLAWVHSSLVSLYGGTLPVVEPPATPTPAQTSTIDPTLAAQFIITIQPTRLPTFTAPPPLEIPTYTETSGNLVASRVPMGMIITGLAALGVFGILISVLRGR